MLGKLLRRMRIQYASDLHLEISGGGLRSIGLRPVAPTLVLAGDIGDPTAPAYQAFLAECAVAWRDVVVVAGNHEFYNKRGQQAWERGWSTPATVAERLVACQAAAAAAGANVHFLDRGRIDIEGVAFLGCTLWSDVTGSEDVVERGMNDCRLICAEGTRTASAEDLKTWHRRDRDWLERELAGCREEGRGAVVVTHHLPTFDLISSRWVGHPVNAGFATALDRLIEEPVRAWICGHSHTAAILHKGAGGRIPCVLNPRGYPRESGTGFSGEIFVDVNTEAGSGDDEREPALAAMAEWTCEREPALAAMAEWGLTDSPDVSGSASSPQRLAELARSLPAERTPPDDDSESDTSPEQVVFL